MDVTVVGNYPGKFILDCLKRQFTTFFLSQNLLAVGQNQLQGNEAIALFISLYLYLSRQVKGFKLFKFHIREEIGIKDCVSQAAIPHYDQVQTELYH